MARYATCDDLAARYPELSAGKDRVEACLDDACAAIDAACDAAGVSVQGVADDRLRMVAVRVAARCLQSGGDGGAPVGVTQETWSASPYGGSLTYANPSGDVYLTKFERSALGLDAQWCGFVSQGAPQ